MDALDMQTMRAVMKAIFGTDARCSRKEQRREADSMLDRVEEKVARLESELDNRRSVNLDEAVRQVSRSDR